MKDHMSDEHAGMWDRFCWFGFRQVNSGCDYDGFCTLRKLAEVSFGSPSTMIGDIEALLIKAMGLRNKMDMNFAGADEWEQVKRLEVDHYRDKLGH